MQFKITEWNAEFLIQSLEMDGLTVFDLAEK